MYDDLVFAIKNKTIDISKIFISFDLGILSMERNLIIEESVSKIFSSLNGIKKLNC